MHRSPVCSHHGSPPRRRGARPIVGPILGTTLAVTLALGLGCPASRDEAAPGEEPAAASPESIWTGDLPALRERGRLRILVQDGGRDYLPRSGSAAQAERRLVEGFAGELGLEPVWVPVADFDELIPALREGRGDLIADNLTITAARRERIAFSAPVTTARELVVTHRRDTDLSEPEQLAGRTLALRRSSSFWSTGESLVERHPGLVLEAVDESLDLDGLLDGVASDRFDLTLVDSNWMEPAKAWHPEVRVAFDLGQDTLIAWGLRKESRALRRAVDGFLGRRQAGAAEVRSRGDLPAIRERGVLRVLTRNNATTYFIWRGRLLGFEYDLMRRFAEAEGLRLEMVVPPSRADLVPWLREGRGDVVAAGLSIDPEWAVRKDVRFTRMYHRVRETLVAPADDPIERVAELAGRTVVVRRSSSYWRTLEELRESGIDLQLEAAPEVLETEQILGRVARGEAEVTVADSHIVSMELARRDDLRAVAQLGEPVEHGWLVREGAEQLRSALDAWLEKEYRGLFYNVTRKKYFDPPADRGSRAPRPARDGTISPWDGIVRRHAARYGFDWRLIVAQVYQESRFDPQARSFAGARGLLQVMPRTAEELGFSDLEDPERGLHAGIRYAAWVRDRFDELPAAERRWFTLAGYNVGPGHVRDARRIARERGWDPDRWFGHVERAMLLKQDPAVYRHTRFGFARGSEPVSYVREIRARYEAYLQMRDVAASPRGEHPRGDA